MVDLGAATAAVIPLTTQIADDNHSGVSLSGTFLVIALLAAGVFLFRRFVMPTATSMLSVAKQIFSTPAGRVVGIAGVILVGFLLLGG